MVLLKVNKVVSAFANRTTYGGYINNVLQGSASDTNTDFATFTSNSVFGTSELSARSIKGKTQELILWETDQSSNRADIEANQATYYGITI